MNARVRQWLLVIAALLGMALTSRLGWWQLERATQKLSMQEAVELRGRLPALGNAELSASESALEPQLNRRVELRGRWLREHTVFLENRPMDGRVGFIVLTPLQLEGREAAVLVQRGWTPRDMRDRSLTPKLDDPDGVVNLRGRLSATPSRVLGLGEAGSGAIRQNLDSAGFARETGLNLLAATVLQLEPVQLADRPVNDGLKRDWPAPDLGLQKHYGYAFQWFALCALILILYVWFQIIRPRLRRAGQ